MNGEIVLTLEQATKIANDLNATNGQYDAAMLADNRRGDLTVTYLTDAGTPGIGPFVLNPDGEVGATA